MNANVRRIAVLVLPVIVLAALIVRAEVIISSGRHYVLSIQGFDPRDLLRGQYLRFRVQWNGYGDLCRSGENEGCLVCMDEEAEQENPRVSERWNGSTGRCQAFIRGDALRNLDQYFIPEDMGRPLERAIRDRRAAIRVAVSHDGDVIIEDLLLDGEPWRDVVSRSSQPE